MILSQLRTTLDMKNDLVYKSMRYDWKLTSHETPETIDNIVENILSEDIDITCTETITVQHLEELKPPLDKMLKRKSSISDQLENLIAKRNKLEESGLTMGEFMKPFLQKKLIQKDLMGCPQNCFHILRQFRKALKSGLKDNIPLKLIVNGLKIKKVRWLRKVQSREIKIVLLAKLVKWLWKVTKSLIASKYYVTEAQGSFKLIYIPKKVWQSRTDKKLNSMIHLGILKPVTEEEAEALEEKRNPAVVRWLPKRGGLRPIISLKKDSKEERRLISRKDGELRAFIQFLIKNYENSTRLKPQELHKVWRSAVMKLGGDRRRAAHLVTVDVEDAYGSIIQEKLVPIVKVVSASCFGFGKQDSFIEFSITRNSKGDVFTCKGLFEASAKKSAGRTMLVKLKDLLERVENIVQCQTVKRMKKTYLMKKGISQAVPVSAALCDLYLSYLTQTKLGEFTTHGEDTLIRAMDDFLYVTPDENRAQLFLKRMSAGFPSFNIFIKKEKTQSTLLGNSKVDYFGFTFDSNLEVFVKHTNGADLSFRHTMTFTNIMTPIDTLTDKMRRIPIYKVNKLTLDPAYNSMRTVCWNVFHTGCLMACSFKAIVNTLGSSRFSTEELVDCVRQSSTSVAVKTFRIRPRNDIYIREIFWILVRAFFLCLAERNVQDTTFSTNFTSTLERIEHEAGEKVRPRLIEQISSFVRFLPAQFKTGY